MISRWFTVINMVLLLGCLGFGAVILPAWMSGPKVGESPGQEAVTDGEDKLAMPIPEPLSYPPLAEFSSVAEKNLFHPDRTFKKPEEQPGPPPEQPTFLLYGIIEAGPDSVAMMEDTKAVQTTPGRGKRVVSVRVGQELSNYRLESVTPDAVVMVRGEDRMTVNLVDPDHPKGRVATATTPVAATAAPAATAPARARAARGRKNLADAFRIARDKNTRTAR